MLFDLVVGPTILMIIGLMSLVISPIVLRRRYRRRRAGEAHSRSTLWLTVGSELVALSIVFAGAAVLLLGLQKRLLVVIAVGVGIIAGILGWVLMIIAAIMATKENPRGIGW